jgi:hypothetical protein
MSAGPSRFKTRIIKDETDQNGEPKVLVVRDHSPDARYPIELDVADSPNKLMAMKYDAVFGALHYLEFRRKWWIEHIGIHLRKIKDIEVLDEIFVVEGRIKKEIDAFSKSKMIKEVKR